MTMEREERDLLIRIDECTKRMEVRLEDHSKRISSLERWKAGIMAGVVIVNATFWGMVLYFKGGSE